MKLKYGFSIQVLQSLLRKKDHEIWNDHLKKLTYNLCLNQQQNAIYLVVKECSDPYSVLTELSQLPLVREEFIELEIHECFDIRSLDLILDS